jgi:hypothetical protein
MKCLKGERKTKSIHLSTGTNRTGININERHEIKIMPSYKCNALSKLDSNQNNNKKTKNITIFGARYHNKINK